MTVQLATAADAVLAALRVLSEADEATVTEALDRLEACGLDVDARGRMRVAVGLLRTDDAGTGYWLEALRAIENSGRRA